MESFEIPFRGCIQMENLRDRLARRLRELMATNLALDTQVKVAQKSGVSQSTVQRVLAKDQAATVDTIQSFAHAFGIKCPELLLLDAQERELLTQWGRLSTGDRAKVLGFIAVTASDPATGQPPTFSFRSDSAIPPDMAAATGRATGRKPGAPLLEEENGRQRQTIKQGNGTT